MTQFVSSKPLLNVLHGHSVWPPPVWLMRQAGRYLPEFRAWREKESFLTRCMTPDIATELTLQPIRRYGMDGAILFSDILILPWALGQKLDFIAGEGPVLDPIRKKDDLLKLDLSQLLKVTQPVMQALKQIKTALNDKNAIGYAPPGHTTLLGFAGSPFTVACYMVEGKGSRDFQTTKRIMFEDTAFFDELMVVLVNTTTNMLKEQIASGADAVMLFDSWAGLLSPFWFRRYVIEPTKKIVSEIKATYPDVPIIGFPRQAGLITVEYARETGLDAIGADTGVDLPFLRKLLPDSVALQGNLDPISLLTGGKIMEDEIKNICLSMKGTPYIFNLGHGVLPQTAPEHVAHLREVIRQL